MAADEHTREQRAAPKPTTRRSLNKLTDAGLRRVKLRTGSAIVQDGGGLRLEVMESGGRRVARAVYRFRLGDARPDFYLGTWPDTSLADLRAARDAAREHVRAGVDPRAAARTAKADAARARAAANAEAAARLTVRGAFERWERLHVQRAFKDGGAEVRRYFEKDVLPELGALPMEDLTRARVAALVDEALARGAPRSAQMLLGFLRQFARWAVARGYLENDPTAALRKADIATNGPRERALSDAETRALAALLPGAGLPKWAPPAIWLLLATAARVGELLGARWDDFDLKARAWHIPASRAKNGRAHVVDLSPFALARLAELKDLRTSDWLVASRALDDADAPAGPVSEKSLSKLVKARQLPEDADPLSKRTKHHRRALVLPGGPWTPHDLRRTSATLLQSLGVVPAVIERCLNHVPGARLVRVYQRYDYRPERREALTKLGAYLQSLSTGKGGRVAARRRSS